MKFEINNNFFNQKFFHSSETFLQPSSLQNNGQKIGVIKRNLEINVEDGDLAKKKIKFGEGSSGKRSEPLVSTVELLDNKFVLSETDGIYKCIRYKLVAEKSIFKSKNYFHYKR